MAQPAFELLLLFSFFGMYPIGKLSDNDAAGVAAISLFLQPSNNLLVSVTLCGLA
jgi:hypothetical protein